MVLFFSREMDLISGSNLSMHKTTGNKMKIITGDTVDYTPGPFPKGLISCPNGQGYPLKP